MYQLFSLVVFIDSITKKSGFLKTNADMNHFGISFMKIQQNLFDQDYKLPEDFL